MKACEYLKGEHDFRNFCKPDIVNVSNFIRKMLNVRVEVNNNASGSDALHSIFLRASGFLWHQIRNIMSVLFIVGKRIDSPEIVKDMLNLKEFPAKPQYMMSSHLPLVLVDCEFDGVNFVKCDVESDLATLWRLRAIPNAIIQICRENDAEDLDQCRKRNFKKEKSLRKRPLEPSIKERVSRLKGKDLDKYKKKQQGYQQFLSENTS